MRLSCIAGLFISLSVVAQHAEFITAIYLHFISKLIVGRNGACRRARYARFPEIAQIMKIARKRKHRFLNRNDIKVGDDVTWLKNNYYGSI